MSKPFPRLRRGRGVALLAGALLLATAQPSSAARPGTQTAPRSGTWVGAWATAPTAVPASGVTTFEDQTIRQVVHISTGGAAVRVRFSNEFGSQPLVIGEARVARRGAEGRGERIEPGSDRRLTFGGRASVSVPAGAPLVSDPVPLAVAADSDLVVSLYLPRRTPGTTVHAFPFQDGFVAAGNVAGRTAVQPTSVVGQWFFLSGVSVLGGPSRHASTVVAFGDSITDGANTTPGTNRRWPDFLARRFQADPRLRHLGVVNEGISGNRLLHDPNPPAGTPAEGYAAYFGQAALRRFDRDVAAQPAAGHVVVLLGVNDLGHPGTTAPESERVTAEDIIAAHRQLIARAHDRGLKVFGGTITPFRDDTFGFYSPENEAARQAVNRWMRTSGEHDGVIDFDAALRDPAAPDRLLPAYDSGDHLHPNDAGMRAMAEAVPLSLFR